MKTSACNCKTTVLQLPQVLFLLLALSFFACSTQPRVKEGRQDIFPPVTEISPRPDYLTIVAAGDNIIHDPILRASYKNNTYSFHSIYEKISGYILPADVAFVNQETILGNKTLGYSGYPFFSTPGEAGAALVAAGFNIVNHATNHIMDRGEAGVLSSMDYWDAFDNVRYLGIRRSDDERAKFVVIRKNNIKIGFLAYTYGTNGISVPADKPYLVSLINTETMAKEIDALRPLCDYLVVSIHWGEEYSQVYNQSQEKLAAFLAEHKVDLVIGHHPHVLEPLTLINRPDGGSMTVFYSLGNFLSAHVRPTMETLMGGLMYIKIKKAGNKITTEEAGLIPIVTHYNTDLSDFVIYPLSEYTEELAERHRHRKTNGEMSVDLFTKKARQLFGSALILENPFDMQNSRQSRPRNTFY
jgi:poly-gamma-glutamate synthesis protein (capsule biosynthesis protein)